MKSFYLIFLSFISFSIVFGQNGKVIDELIINSKILKGDRKFAVYLPPDYDSSNRSYPVLYLLHGLGDNQSAWIQFGEVLHTTDKAINSGIATSMIIIMPDAGTGQMGYTNAMSGKWNYEDFFFEGAYNKLDECNGGMFNGKYVYFITDNYPRVPRCLYGKVSSDFNQSRH